MQAPCHNVKTQRHVPVAVAENQAANAPADMQQHRASTLCYPLPKTPQATMLVRADVANGITNRLVCPAPYPPPVSLCQYGLGGMLRQLMGHQAHRHNIKAASRQLCVLSITLQQCQRLGLT